MNSKKPTTTTARPDHGSGLRFAFYGRTSTTRHQDRVSSQGWQRDMADELVGGHGQVVATYFDVGTSRRVPWRQRPQAAQLMTETSSPESAIDAIVVGEYERAFTCTQFATLYSWSNRHGIQLWLPETAGPVDLSNRDHRALMSLLATQSQREVLRARHRVLAAMHNQATQQGRYLGGRPPYGYQLVDAGPHPNPTDARWGRRLQRLAPDPRTAPHVAWIFRQRLAGHSVASIARHRNDRGVPCPSSADPDRNRHRTRGAWTLRTVAVILANPRYTGRQTWNRRATDTRGPAATPALSGKAAHLALVTEQDFIAAQQIRAARPAHDGRTRRFARAGLIHCGVCDRRLDSHWNHGRATYRRRHGYNSTQCAGQSRPKTLYIREDYLVEEISIRLGERGNDGHDTPELDRPRHRRVAAALRDSRKIIVYDHAGWRLKEIDSS
ncbi:recombinase family protein [Amycolatopsis sp. A133]|uniref:recombinase family protein n=1 Tax=Amycolatopsis sp. A133 TaxID=3064472 RepID=UPI0027F3B6D0|nr:recombinase family protein [Amycolatopsis sp. A133]MDQ7809049.1 recombinase family protein [Amycolatopsis sp. A133]